MFNRSEKEIMKNWPADWNEPLVSVWSLAYNHEHFVSKALDSFLMQETDFPFEIVVHDDASTDRTAEIIREYERKYPRIIKAFYETENQYSKKNDSINKKMKAICRGKYYAFCECDDFWIDSYKLRKQVAVLERDASIGLVYTNRLFLNNDTGKYSFKSWNKPENATTLAIMENRNCIHTLTVMLRREIIQDRPVLSSNYFQGDIYTFMYVMEKYKCQGLDDVTGVYRVLTESASHFKSFSKSIQFQFGVAHIKLYFLKRDCLPEPAKSKHISWNSLILCKYFLYTNQFDHFCSALSDVAGSTLSSKLKAQYIIFKILNNKLLFKMAHGLFRTLKK